jgi:hypothetical protein
MRRTLGRRLERIEVARGAKANPGIPELIVVSFVEGNGAQCPMNHARTLDGRRVWQPLPGEDKDAFVERIRPDVLRDGAVEVIVLDPDDAKL